MNRYSWHTTTEKDSGGWYKCTAIVVFHGNTVKFDTYPFYKSNRKGGHRHRRNYCICNVCGHWFRKNKGIHEEGFDFCGGKCDSQAIWEASLEADVGGGFEPHFWEE